jgi:hypothetical protein
VPLGTQFPCFTGTKVQILTQKALLEFVPASPEEQERARTRRETLERESARAGAWLLAVA